MNIRNIGFSSSISCVSSVDSEEKEIMRRLLAYGITPTGNKITDRAKLREIELERAKNSNYVIPDLFTVSKSEQDEIQKVKKDKRKEIEKSANNGNLDDLDNLGKQIYIAIQLKKKKSIQTQE